MGYMGYMGYMIWDNDDYIVDDMGWYGMMVDTAGYVNREVPCRWCHRRVPMVIRRCTSFKLSSAKCLASDHGFLMIPVQITNSTWGPTKFHHFGSSVQIMARIKSQGSATRPDQRVFRHLLYQLLGICNEVCLASARRCPQAMPAGTETISWCIKETTLISLKLIQVE